MDKDILLQILEELKAISTKLSSIEQEVKREPLQQPSLKKPTSGASALAHLNSLGVNW